VIDLTGEYPQENKKIKYTEFLLKFTKLKIEIVRDVKIETKQSERKQTITYNFLISY